MHGILRNTNSGVEIPGTANAKGLDVIEFTIDGSPHSNYFARESGWEFVPDPKPVPTKRGIWLLHHYGLDADGDLSNFPNLILHSREGWFSIGNLTGESERLTEQKVRNLFNSDDPPVPLTVKEG